MHRFVDCCIHYIDTYGEYEATKFITRQYREIPQVGKLMRLIRQANEGGDVRAELVVLGLVSGLACVMILLISTPPFLSNTVLPYIFETDSKLIFFPNASSTSLKKI